MRDEPTNLGGPAAGATNAASLPTVVDRDIFQAELDRLRVREKAHTREGDAIAAARRRLPMAEADASIALTGPHGPLTLLDAFEGRRQLIAYYFMWWPGHPAAEQCEGCTWVTTQGAELAYRAAHPARRVRRAPPAHRLLLHVVARPPGGRAVRRLHVGHHPGRGAVLPAFPRHHLRGLLPGPLRRERPLPRLHGLGHAVVLSTRLPRRAPVRAPDRLVPPGVLRTGRRPRLRDLLDDPPRRRGNGLQLRAHGPHRARTPGAVGGLAPRLAATVLHAH